MHNTGVQLAKTVRFSWKNGEGAGANGLGLILVTTVQQWQNDLLLQIDGLRVSECVLLCSNFEI